MNEENNLVRNTLRDQELVHEIRDQFNINCELDYIIDRFVFYVNRYLNRNYTVDDLYQLTHNLDDTSIQYVKSFLLKVIIKNHPDYKELINFYPKTILSYIIPKEELEIYQYPQQVFFSKEFLEKRKRYNLDNLYNLVMNDAGIKLLPEYIIPQIKDGVILDGGAYDGETAVVFSDYTDKKVYAFEFVKKHLAMVEDKIKQYHKEDQIEIVKLGISDVNTSFTFNDDVCSSGATLEGAIESQEAESGFSVVHTTTLDDFVDVNKIEKVSLIKFDIEGFEPKGIQGMKKLLQRDKPILLISIYHHLNDFVTIKSTLEKMNLGYKFRIRHLEPIVGYCTGYDRMADRLLHETEYMLFAYIDD